MDCIEGTVRNKTITKVIITCFVEVEESSLFFITVIAGLLDVLLPSMYPWPTRHTVPRRRTTRRGPSGRVDDRRRCSGVVLHCRSNCIADRH